METVSLWEVFDIIEMGGIITDIGQISKLSRCIIRQRVKDGRYEEFKSYRFPSVKNAWSLRQCYANR